MSITLPVERVILPDQSLKRNTLSTSLTCIVSCLWVWGWELKE